jgi:hypothetical protein
VGWILAKAVVGADGAAVVVAGLLLEPEVAGGMTLCGSSTEKVKVVKVQ